MDIDPPLTPPVDGSRTPPFFEMNQHPKRFERMSARLMDAEVSVKEADLFGIDGQTQYGVDVLAERVGGDGIEVGSCKCYFAATTGLLEKWSDEFLNHWDGYWNVRSVRRFILITAATNITSTTLRDQIAIERARFQAIGVEYDVWGPAKLEKLLQSNRLLAVRCLGDTWADILCGKLSPDPVAGRMPAGALSAFQVDQLRDLQTSLSGQIEQRVELATRQLRRGDHGAVEALIAELKVDAVWSQLQPQAQARVLRLEGSHAVQRGDLAEAKRLADSADQAAPGEPRLRAHIALLEGSAADALEVLGEPATLAGRQLQAALLLQVGELAEVERLIERLVSEADDDAENYRLLSYLRLTQNRRQDALTAAERAEELAPDWLAVIRVGAIVRYACALSPSVNSTWIFYPNPVDLDLVKQDDASQAAIAVALSRFEQLIAKGDSVEDDQIWKLACLSNLVGRRLVAEAYCAEILYRNPENIDAIGWALARGYAGDRSTSRAALASIYDQGGASQEQVRAYAWLLYEAVGAEGAAIALEKHRAVQTGDGGTEAQEWLERLRSGVETVLDDDSGDEDFTPPRDLPERIEQAVKFDDWAEMEGILDHSLAGQPPHASGLAIAQSLAAHGRWDSLQPHLEQILGFDTAAAVGLAAFVLHHVGTPDEVLDLLERKRQSFPAGNLSADLQRIEIAATAAKGDLPTALHAAESLAARTQLAHDRLHYAQLHLSVGDTAAALPIIRDALRSGDLHAQDALRYSVAFSRDDPNLARQLWRHAVQLGVRDKLVVNALSQAFRLELDDEAGPLMPLIQARAESNTGDVWQISLDEAVEQMKEHQRRGADAIDQLEVGGIPNHVLPGITNVNFARIYQLDRSNAGSLGTLFIRHGSRPLDVHVDFPWATWQLHLDISGLLIADQLDLLTELESLTAPVLISRHMPDALYQLEQISAHQQPSRIKVGKSILAARARNVLAIVTLPEAEESEIVRYERGREERGAAGPTLHSTADALHQLGEIDDDLYKLALSSLGTRADSANVLPSPSTRLIFSDNTLEGLASAGLLEPALRQFRCEISVADFRRVEEEVRVAAAGEQLADRLSVLRLRIAQGVEDGHYAFAQDLTEPTGTDEPARSTLEHCLFDLIAAPSVQNGVVWSDDRFMTGYTSSNGNLIIGVVEVLNALHKAGKVSASARQSKLLKLREGGALFIPVGTDEVMTPLVAARMGPAGVVETPALRVLRRYLSSALTLDSKLAIGAGGNELPKGRRDEIGFLQNARRLAEDCIVKVWRDRSTTPSICRARSDWLWASLRMEQCVRTLPGRGNENLAALLVAGLLAHSNEIVMSNWQATMERRRAYFAWIEDTIVSSRLGTPNDQFFEIVDQQLKALLNASIETYRQTHNSIGLSVAQRLLRMQIALMPGQIQQTLIDDGAFTTRVGLRTARHVVIGRLRLDFERFWSAIQRSGRYGRARLRTTNGRKINLRRENDHIALSGAVKTKTNHDLYPVVVARAADRTREIHEFLEKLDLPPNEQASVQASAERATSAGQLAAILEDARENSVITAYQRPANAIRKGASIEPSLFFPPTAERMAHHLRLSESSGSVAERVATAWNTLSARIGPRHAFRRLAGLPVNLAAHMAGTLGSIEKEEALQAILAAATTPMSAIHAGRLCQELGQGPAEVVTHVRRLIEGTRDHGSLFSVLLTWSEQAFQRDDSWWAAPVGDRLALVWAHADRLLDLLIGHKVDIAIAKKYFAENRPDRSVSAVLRRDRTYGRDCASPELTFAETPLFHGLAHIYGNEDISDAIPSELLQDLIIMMTNVDGEVFKPAAGLLARSGPTLDSMGSIFKLCPVGLFDEAMEPARVRANELDGALDALETNPQAFDPWLRIVALGRPALDDTRRERVEAIFKRVSLTGLVNSIGDLDAARVVVDVRRRLGGPVDDNELFQKLFEFAQDRAAHHAGPVDEEGASPSAAAFNEVVELMAMIAHDETKDGSLERFATVSRIVAKAWPAAVTNLRQLFDGLVRRESPAEASALWGGFVALRSMH